MIIILINLLIVVPICLTIYFLNCSIGKANGNIILGATVPTSKMEDRELLVIIEEYKKANKKYTIVALIISLPFSIMEYYNIYGTLYIVLWSIFISIYNQIILKKYFNKIQALKRKNDWFISKRNVVSIDTEVSRQKDKMPISKLWFLPTVLVNIIGILIGVNIIVALSFVFTAIVNFIFYNFYSNRRTVVYCKDSQINLACNYVNRRSWSIMWTLAGFLGSVPIIAFKLGADIGIITVIICTFIMIMIFIVGNSKIRDTSNRLLSGIDNEIITDDDEYWGAFFYNNPNDKNFMVDKRFGIGTTINIAHPKAKVFLVIILLITLGPLIPCLVIDYKLSDADFSLSLDQDKVTIKAPMYGIEFDKSEIEEVTKITELPKGIRTNGEGSSKVDLGNFNISGYGGSKVFVHKEVKDIVVIRLKDKYVFITGKDAEETEEYYKLLVK